RLTTTGSGSDMTGLPLPELCPGASSPVVQAHVALPGSDVGKVDPELLGGRPNFSCLHRGAQEILGFIVFRTLVDVLVDDQGPVIAPRNDVHAEGAGRNLEAAYREPHRGEQQHRRAAGRPQLADREVFVPIDSCPLVAHGQLLTIGEGTDCVRSAEAFGDGTTSSI